MNIQDEITEAIDKYITPSVSCAGCASSIYTLKMGVERTLQHLFPKSVKSVSHEESEITNPYYT